VTGALVRRRDHLVENRRMILGHTLASTLSGLVPLPYVSEWLPAMVKRDLVRRIAESRGVDLDEAAVRMIAEGEVQKPGWRSALSATPLLRFAGRSLRAAFAALNVYRAADGAARTFALATLFDHYCARLHVGGEMDAGAARVLRKRMEAAVRSPAGGLFRFTAARALTGALDGARRAPVAVLQALRGRPARAADEVEAEEITAPVEQRLAGGERTFVEALVEEFERQ
jgi:uncharacterized protein (DUF697 family)